MSVDTVIEQALKLSIEDRKEVVDRLLMANATEERVDPNWHAAWTTELDRRLADIHEGRVQLVEADEAFARLRAAADRHR